MGARPPNQATTDRQADEAGDGFVLISVLWIAGLLAIVSMTFAINARTDLLAGSNAVQGAKSEFIADGVADVVAWKLAVADGGVSDFPKDGRPWSCRWSGDAVARISVQDQSGLVDLNAAPAALITRVLVGSGLPTEQAEAITEAIVDYRDADSAATNIGSEPDLYPGASFGPKNAPFQAVEELDQIPGIDADIYRSLRPMFTVHSLYQGFDPAVLAPTLQQALGVASAAGYQLPADLAPYVATSPNTVFSIDVTAMLANGTRFRRVSLISLLREPDRPFAVLSWQRGGDEGAKGTTTNPARSCLN